MSNEIQLGTMEIKEAQALRDRLKKEGVEVILKGNDNTCRSGNCKVTVDLWAQEQDLGLIREFMSKEFFGHLKGHNINLEALNQVFDPNASEVTCQACGFKFSSDKTECPDCGLVYG